MKALSIKQPWVYAILHLGKRLENRNWKPTNPHRKFRGQFLLHVSKSRTGEDREDYGDLIWRGGHIPGFIIRKRLLAMPDFEKLERGGIVGIASVVGLIDRSFSEWFSGPVALELANVQPLPFTPCKGQLGFFDVDTTALGLDAHIRMHQTA